MMMTDIKIDDHYVAELGRQFARWKIFLNGGIGLVAFSLALSCLGTKTPVLNAWLSMAVLVCIRIYGKDQFPAEVTRLRKEAKHDPKAAIVLHGVLHRFMGMKTLILGYTVLLIGYLLLVFVMFSWAIAYRFPSLAPIVHAYVGSQG
jgi:hypothetical protein